MDFILMPAAPERQRALPEDPGPCLHCGACGGSASPLTTDDAPEYRPALRETGLDRQQCTVHMQRTVGRHLRRIDDDLTHLDGVLLPILQRLVRERPPEAGPVLLGLWEAVAQGRVRLRDPDVPASTNGIEGWFGRFKPRARLARGLKSEAGALNFVHLMAEGMA